MNWTRKEVTRLLEENGLQLKRSLGQNYLVDGNFLEALARDAEAGPGDTVVEIGSGLGNLTEKLAAQAKRGIAIEIDEAIHGLSRALVGALPNGTWLRGDRAGFARQRQGRNRIVS